MEQKNNFDLIVTIVNRGFSDYVIETAKQFGASGATVLNARGSGADENNLFFGVHIHPEKEVVLILVLKAQKKHIMSEIVRAANLSQSGKGICFSLPVNSVAGTSQLFKTNARE